MLNVFAVPIYSDNYVWVIQNAHQCWVVDPGACAPVAQAITKHGLDLAGILVTHKHWDHISGITQLKQPKTPVYGPSCVAINQITQPVAEGDNIPIGHTQAMVLATPGHTREHISYYLPSYNWLFSGDTLFSAGSGRLFDGTAEQLFNSFNKIKRLPSKTKVFATHEYTLANLRFAEAVEPNNNAIKQLYQHCQKLRQQNQRTLPTSLEQECAVNPFLRVHLPAIKKAVEAHFDIKCQDECEVFKHLRLWKDQF